MSDKFKLPEGLTFDDKEDVTEEVPKEIEDGTLIEEAKPIPEEEKTPFFGNVISEDTKTGTIVEEQIRGISKIVDKFQGKEIEGDVSLIESLVGATMSAGIKIPKGLITFGTLLTDIFREDGIPVDETLTAKFNEAFDQSTLGKIERASEEVAAETAAGKITEAIGQLYGAGKIAKKTIIPVVEKGSQKVRQLVSAIKSGRYVKTTNNVNAARAIKEANKLNTITGTDKFAAIAIGGGIGAGFIVSDVEDIGTFGDWDYLDFLPTGLDRTAREEGGEESKRQLLNRLKFGGELAFPIVPFIVGGGKIGKLIVQKGKDIAYSDSMLERWIDRFIAKPFRSRSNKTQELFDGIQKLEGKKSAIKILAKDASRNIDDSIRKISRETKGAAQALNDPANLSKLVAEFTYSADDVVKKNKIVFPGFNQKVRSKFVASLNKLGVPKKSAEKIIADTKAFRETATGLKNLIAASKNVKVGTEKLNKILNERIKNVLAVDYKIIDDNAGLFNGYTPTNESINQVAKILQRYARDNARSLDSETAVKLVNNITKNAFKDKSTNALVFDIGEESAFAAKPVQTVNIGKYITSGKFKPDGRGGLIQKESDLTAFKKLFGEYKNAQKGIYSVMTDLSEVIARDEFYTNLLKDSQNIAKQLRAGADPGQIGRPIFFKRYNKAVTELPFQVITRQPLNLKTKLPDTIYKSPLDGYFTTQPYAEAIRVGNAVVGNPITRSLPYRIIMLIPKGAAQAAKTVLGFFTHARNFFSAAITTVHRGNILIPPAKIGEFANRARKAVQPQILYRMTGNPKYRNAPQDQAMYRFLLEEGVTNQNVRAREIEGMFDDVAQIRTRYGTTDRFFNKVLNTGTKKFKQIYDVAQDLYTAEDDVFRVYNFLAEAHKLDNAFEIAIKKGIKDASGKVVTRANKPSDLAIMKEAAQIVRETVPNYAYVSDFVKSIRRSPLGNFAAFPAEIYRTGTNTLMRGLKESKDPIRKQIGFNSLVGQGFTYTFLPVAAVELFRGMYGITRKQLSAIREVLPTWSEDNTILPIYEDGKYKYIDFSHGFFYDTMIQPVQTTLSTVQKGGDDKPLVPMILDAMVKAGEKVLDPFIGEAIWTGVVLDIFARGGKTKDGRTVFNDRDPLGDKISKSFAHAAYELSPFSYAQVVRLTKALTGDTLKGDKYQIPDELLGFTGFRKVPINLEKNLNFKIAEFKRNTFEERKLIYQGTRTGDPVKDENRIIRQYIKANKQHLESYSKLRRIYDAVKVLGMRDSKISEEFADQKSMTAYGFVEDNAFKPFSISKDVIAGFDKLSEEKGIPNPLNDRVLNQLEKIQDVLFDKQKLNQPFVINEKDYLLPETNTSMVPPLPEQPMPNAAVVQTPAPVTETGLTMVEKALLSDEEKMMTLKNRGLA
tara:strand:- start:639 stop:4832 length:4194 start_codon:yes stop_codon:yes gene_type:complete